MGFVNKASFIPAVLVVFLTGCALTQPTSSTAQKEQKTQLTPKEQPNPKPRPKSEPVYPPARLVIAWHAEQCGGFKSTPQKQAYVGQKELISLFKYLCIHSASEPKQALALLESSDQAYYWPDDIKQYLWLQKQSVQHSLKAKQAKQALTEKMEKTLSSLAAIEQQLLLREETKEQ